MNRELLQQCLRDRLDSNRQRFRSDLQRQDEREELVKIVNKLTSINYIGKDFAREFVNDAKFNQQ